MRVALVFVIVSLSVVACVVQASAVSFNCVPYFKTNVPVPPNISNVTQIQNATQQQAWVVICNAIPVTVTTDKLSYASGDVITVQGTASNTPAGVTMAIKVVAPNGNVVWVGQMPVGSDGTFSTKIRSGGNLWQQAGMYDVETREGSTQRSASTAFYFSGPAAPPYSSSILVQNTTITIPYTIVNGKINSVRIDPYMRSVVVSMQSTGKGALTIDLPRNLIDSKGANQTDLNFVVTSDGRAPSFEETKSASSRDLIIPFENDTKQIRIIGTRVIPEFGPLAEAMLVVATVGTLVVVTRYGNLKLHH